MPNECTARPLDQLVAAPLAGHVVEFDTSRFAIVEWRDSGAPPGPPPPFVAPVQVKCEDDAGYKLDGTLPFKLGDQEVEARTHMPPTP